MINTNELKVEIAKLTKQENMLRQQREQVQAQLHGTIGAKSQLQKLLAQSEKNEDQLRPPETLAEPLKESAQELSANEE